MMRRKALRFIFAVALGLTLFDSVADAAGCDDSSSRFGGGVALQVVTTTLPAGARSQAYTTTLQAAGGRPTPRIARREVAEKN